MTIGLFCDNFYPMLDGVVLVVDNYARRLVKYANVIVFVPEASSEKYNDRIFPYKVVRCKSIKVPFIDYRLPIPRLTLNYYKQIEKYKLDIVHIHSPFGLGKMGIKYAKKHHIPVIGTMHSQFKRDLDRFIKSDMIVNQLLKQIINVFDKCDECWAVNSEVARIFYEDYGYKVLPEVVNNATDMRPVDDLKKANEIVNKKYKLKSREKVFLFVGRLNKLKNILFIIDALKILKDKKLKFKMLFVGAGQDESLLKEAIKENDLEDNVILCGKIYDREMIASLYDASSLVQIEAASQKTPTIFIEGSVTSTMITDNVNGFIAKNNVKEYANVIMKVLKDKKLYREVSDNCYKDLYKSWDDLTKEVYERYVSLIEKNNI